MVVLRNMFPQIIYNPMFVAAILLAALFLTTSQGQNMTNVSVWQSLKASPITRDQIMQRAQVWVDEAVPYSQTATTNGYRQDCRAYKRG